MLKRKVTFLLLLTLQTGFMAAAASGQSVNVLPKVSAQGEFTHVEGNGLQAKAAAALRLAGARSQKAPYWLAYSFDVRPGVTVDLYESKTGNIAQGWQQKPAANRHEETRNLAVFMLYEPEGNTLVQVEVYNLDRKRSYGGYQVYWLGAARNDESLTLLQTLVKEHLVRKIAEPATTAIALHNETRVPAVLEEIVRNSTYEKARARAIFWLGQFDGEQPFLAALVGNDEESTEVRKQAAFSIGVGKDKGALGVLRQLYAPVGNREVKKQIVFAASINEAKDQAADFLLDVAQTEADRELRKQAIFWLGQKVAEHAVDGSRGAGYSAGAEAAFDGQTIFAISRRPQAEAVPLLTRIATTNLNIGVRQQAMFWLGQINDEQALKLCRKVLKK